MRKMCFVDVMPFTDARGERKETLGAEGAMLEGEIMLFTSYIFYNCEVHLNVSLQLFFIVNVYLLLMSVFANKSNKILI